VELERLLSKEFCEICNIDLSKEYAIEYIDASKLLVPERIDLIAKYKYIECRDKGFEIPFFKELYAKHIEAFSYGTYMEPGNPNKITLQDYLETFENLMDEIKKNGIDPEVSVIPVGKDNVIMNGSHRVAIALYYGLQVPIVRFDDLYVDYGLNFFRQHKLEEKFLDFMVTEFIHLKKDLYVACLFPSAKGMDHFNRAIQVMEQKANILYQKEIKIKKEGLRNLITQLYPSETNQWIGTYENHYAGVCGKLQGCSGAEPLRIFVLSCNSVDQIKSIKTEVRNIYQIENHSIHITDTYEEAVSLADIVFNPKSVHCLNYGCPDYFIKFNKKLNCFKERIIKYNLPMDQFVIDSSSVMGLYGLRDIGDIDFLTLATGYEVIEDAVINSNHKNLGYYDTSMENLILNPENYLVYSGIKFITLDVCKTYKKNRNEKKDRIDIKLINTIQNINDFTLVKRYDVWINNKRRTLYYTYMLCCRNQYLLMGKQIIKKILYKLHLSK
jgi:hypothetical protein